MTVISRREEVLKSSLISVTICRESCILYCASSCELFQIYAWYFFFFIVGSSGELFQIYAWYLFFLYCRIFWWIVSNLCTNLYHIDKLLSYYTILSYGKLFQIYAWYFFIKYQENILSGSNKIRQYIKYILAVKIYLPANCMTLAFDFIRDKYD